ncbi:putative defensin-like protein 27 [Arabidopsis lyrata subsp. lyrata]|uniref:putative defensin-like protein 27 n=1 Tax=Arabidopsis lyrata subsp. lyrata TaxID=81972 RepID=UPI000A29E4AD|nr:putative defensin-like protein 27 [Arabidopsis lyrata subsp. lyrata]|eukprot:XP_020875082.1 putative defensin-like protein 27 [Arabidopsis lyrata subsp. lyrata]
MVHSRFVFFAFLALSVLLAVNEEDSIWSSNKGDSLCCNDHPEFGICTNNISCNKWCLQGCSSKRGGFCKRRICHCYC